MNLLRTTFLLALTCLAVACGEAEPKPDGPAPENNATSSANSSSANTTPNNLNVVTVDAGQVDPACATADSNGFFSNCDVCGDDCDSIDAPGVSGNACGCSTGGCPCGLRCGSYEIAPGVSVDNICVR